MYPNIAFTSLVFQFDKLYCVPFVNDQLIAILLGSEG